jgi:ribosomal-protein-alanine N-acetyltransferase
MNYAQVSVRRMKQADLEAVMGIAASLDQAPSWPQTAYLAALRTEGAPSRIALVAETVPGAVVGFVIASLIAPQAELETIAVATQAQRGGAARRLFSELAAELRLAKVEELLLEVRALNRPALEFYLSLGFEETGRRPGYYADPVEDAILMRFRPE